jgi:hypothetical protein
MRYLLLSSLLLILCCAPRLYQDLSPADTDAACLEKLRPRFTSVLYNTSVDVMGKHLSGLLLFKTMPDSSERVIFSNEMGLKFFDFEYTTDTCRVMSVISQLDRPAVLNQLKEDIGYLLMHRRNTGRAKVFTRGGERYYSFPEGETTTYYITDEACSRVSRIENCTDRKKKVVVNLTGTRNGIADSAYIAHQFFDFTISLKQLER